MFNVHYIFTAIDVKILVLYANLLVYSFISTLTN